MASRPGGREPCSRSAARRSGRPFVIAPRRLRGVGKSRCGSLTACSHWRRLHSFGQPNEKPSRPALVVQTNSSRQLDCFPGVRQRTLESVHSSGSGRTSAGGRGWSWNPRTNGSGWAIPRKPWKAEGEGFEPSSDLTARNGFRDRDEHRYLQGFCFSFASLFASQRPALLRAFTDLTTDLREVRREQTRLPK